MIRDYVKELESWDIKSCQKSKIRLWMAYYALDALHDTEVAKEAASIAEELG